MSAVAEEVRFYTVDEVARILRLSVDSVYRRVATGELGAVRLGVGPRAPIRIPVKELEHYAREGTGH